MDKISKSNMKFNLMIKYYKKGKHIQYHLLLILLSMAEIMIYSSFSLTTSELISLLKQDSLLNNEIIVKFLILTIAMLLIVPLKVKITYIYNENSIFTHRINFSKWMTYLNVSDIEKSYTGNIVAKTQGDIKTIIDYYSTGVLSLISSIMQIFFIVFYGFTVNKLLTLVTLLSFALVFTINTLMSKKIGRNYGKSRKCFDGMFAKITEIFCNLEKIKFMGIEEKMKKILEESCSTYHTSIINEVVNREIISSTLYIVTMVPPLMILGFGGYLLIVGEMSLAPFVGFVTFIMLRASNIVQGLSTFLSHFQKGMVSVKRLDDLYEMHPERIGGKDNNKSYEHLISLKDVSFSYDNSKNSINNINLHVDAGEHVAIVGQSGSGKSSIIKLLNGWYDSFTGQVLILGQDINEWSLVSMRENIALVPQELFLFSGTIRENIVMGKLTATDEEIVDAISYSSATSIIKKAGGLDFILNNNGNNISGGEKQRITLSRALIKNAKLFIFDEISSALDSNVEKDIQKTICKLRDKGHGILSISHRLASVKNCDRIYVLKKNTIVAEGTHEQLLNSLPSYYKIFKSQLSEEV